MTWKCVLFFTRGVNCRDDYHIEGIDKKVTIILLISFQLSYNKADKDLYNPI